MPDLSTRYDHEAQITSDLFGVFKQAREEALKSPGSVDWAAVQHKSEEKLAANILLIYLLALGGMKPLTGDFHPSDDTAKTLADSYAKTRSREVIGKMLENMRREINDAGNQSVADLMNGTDRDEAKKEYDKKVDDVFSESRAENVGVTETTEAITEGETAAADEFNKKQESQPQSQPGGKSDGQPGGDGATLPPIGRMQLVDYWVTEKKIRPEATCPICRALDGKKIKTLPPPYDHGPTAHQSCRCFKRWILEFVGATNLQN